MSEFKRTSSDEINRKIIAARSWAHQARIHDLTPDVKYRLAYDSCRMWCEIVLRAENVRVKGKPGYHAQIIEKVSDYLGEDFDTIQRHLQQARKIRNSVAYEGEIEYVTASAVENLIVTIDELGNHSRDNNRYGFRRYGFCNGRGWPGRAPESCKCPLPGPP